MKFVSFVVVAVLTSLLSAGCNGQSSPTSPSQVTTPPVTPVPSGPVQIAVLRGFELNAFVPGVSFGGGGSYFDKTVDSTIDFRVELGKADDYKLVVAVFSYRPGDLSGTPEVLATGLLFFTGNNSSIELKYDGSKCHLGRCYVSLQNRSDKMVERNDANMARVYGTLER